jgi:hypothetical protein
MDVTTDDIHDSEVLPRLLKDASMNRDVIKHIRYREFIHHSQEDGYRTDYNARTDSGPPERRASAAILNMFGERGWSRVMGYGRRWAVETAFST